MQASTYSAWTYYRYCVRVRMGAEAVREYDRVGWVGRRDRDYGQSIQARVSLECRQESMFWGRETRETGRRQKIVEAEKERTRVRTHLAGIRSFPTTE